TRVYLWIRKLGFESLPPQPEEARIGASSLAATEKRSDRLASLRQRRIRTGSRAKAVPFSVQQDQPGNSRDPRIRSAVARNAGNSFAGSFALSRKSTTLVPLTS